MRIKEENHTWATVTLQNYFRLYEKLAGMTGTAETEAAEFGNTYKLSVVPIPTNVPSGRDDEADLIYKTEDAKFDADRRGRASSAATAASRSCSARRRSRSPSSSARAAPRRGVPHEVLNAKQHFREAEIVAQAGRPQRGHRRDQHGRPRRRHPPRRQRRGPRARDAARRRASSRGPRSTTRRAPRRSARLHGDLRRGGGEVDRSAAGSTCSAPSATSRAASTTSCAAAPAARATPARARFFLSLEDDLMRLFATGAVSWVMDRALPDDQPIEAKMVTKAIERAQNTVEGRNAEIRKDVLKYDEVMNEQRKVIYARRQQILDGRGPPRRAPSS